MKQWAITVGINQYQFFQPLSYAQRDAQALRNLLVEEAGFAPEQCLLMTDTSPPVWGKPTNPSRENIQGWIDLLSQQYLQPGDLLWYFFSGYGVCHQGQDYLMPAEGDPGSVDTTAIPLEMVFHRLRQIPSESVLLLLDMNRNQSSTLNEAVGAQTASLANQSGVSTILSCQPGQFSREAADLGHGFFTAALLESLRSHQCETMATLNHYLSDRIPELSEHYWRPIQQPLIISPPEKIHQIMLPGASDHDQGYSQVHPTLSLAQPNGLKTMTILTERSLIEQSLSTATAFNPVSLSERADTNGATLADTNGATQNGNVFADRRSTNNVSANDVPVGHNGHNNHTVSSTPTPLMTPPPNDSQDLEAASDRLFWRPILLWGGLTVAVLLLGVVLRNWTALTQGTPTTTQPETSHSTTPATGNQTLVTPSTPGVSSDTTPSPGTGSNQLKAASQPLPIAPPQAQTGDSGQTTPIVTEKTSPAPTTGAPKPGVEPLLAQPRSDSSKSAIAPTLEATKSRLKLTVVNSDQASPYWYAIQDASKIPPGHPQYKEAQQQIASWSQEIFNIALRRARRRNFDGAIVAAALVPAKQTVTRQSKSALGGWCPSLSRQRVGNTVQRQQAKDICRRM